MKRKKETDTQAIDHAEASGAEHEGRQAAENSDDQERKPFPKRRPWEHDNVAGVERSTYSDKEANVFETWLQFRDGKPSEEVRAAMKSQGFRWQSKVPDGGQFDAEGAWVRPHKAGSIAQDRLVGERTFRQVVDMILEEKGLTREPEQAF